MNIGNVNLVNLVGKTLFWWFGGHSHESNHNNSYVFSASILKVCFPGSQNCSSSSGQLVQAPLLFSSPPRHLVCTQN